MQTLSRELQTRFEFDHYKKMLLQKFDFITNATVVYGHIILYYNKLRKRLLYLISVCVLSDGSHCYTCELERLMFATQTAS